MQLQGLNSLECEFSNGMFVIYYIKVVFFISLFYEYFISLELKLLNAMEFCICNAMFTK